MKTILFLLFIPVFCFSQRQFSEFPEESAPDSTDIVISSDGTRNEKIQLKNILTNGVVKRNHIHSNVIQDDGGLKFDVNNALYVGTDGVTVDVDGSGNLQVLAGSLSAANPFYIISADGEDTLYIQANEFGNNITAENVLNLVVIEPDGSLKYPFRLTSDSSYFYYTANGRTFVSNNSGIIVRDTIFVNNNSCYLHSDGTSLFFTDLEAGQTYSLLELTDNAFDLSPHANEGILINNSGALGTSSNFTYNITNRRFNNGLSSSLSGVGSNILGGNAGTVSGPYSVVLTGTNVNSTGTYTIGAGDNVTAHDFCETVIGHYPTIATGSTGGIGSNNRLFSIGDGVSGSRSNAFSVYSNGKLYLGDVMTDTSFMSSISFHSGTSFGDSVNQLALNNVLDTALYNDGTLSFGAIPAYIGGNQLSNTNITYGSGELQMGNEDLTFGGTVGSIFSSGSTLRMYNDNGEQRLIFSDDSLYYQDLGVSGTNIFSAGNIFRIFRETIFEDAISLAGEKIGQWGDIGGLSGVGNITSAIDQNLSTQVDQGIVFIDGDSLATNSGFTYDGTTVDINSNMDIDANVNIFNSSGNALTIETVNAYGIQSSANGTGSPALFSQSGSVANSSALIQLSRTISGSGNVTGNIISITDNPITGGTISGGISYTVGGIERIGLYPRMVAGSGGTAYFFDTNEELVSDDTIFSIYNQGLKRFSVDYAGNVEIINDLTVQGETTLGSLIIDSIDVKKIKSIPLVLNYSATVTLYGDSAMNRYCTLTGDINISLDNMARGATYTLKLIQDGTGGHTPTFSTGFDYLSNESATFSEAIDAINLVVIYIDENGNGLYSISTYTP
jgi:hypothetical protein